MRGSTKTEAKDDLINRVMEQYSKGGYGSIACPLCGDRVSFSADAKSGKIAAKCATQNCLNITE